MPILGVIASSISGNLWPANSYESIATATGTGSSNVITLSSIPQTYKHLQVRGIIRSTEGTSGTNYYTTLNGNSGTVYSQHRIQGDGTSVGVSGQASQTGVFTGRAPGGSTTAGTMATLILDIYDYALTSNNKTFRMLSGQDSNNAFAGLISIRSSVYQSTSAITSITFTIDTPANFSTNTSFALYGIK